MRILSKEIIAFGAQVEGIRGEILAESPIALQSRCKRAPNEPMLTYGHSWPQCPSFLSTQESDRTTRNGDTAIRG